MIGLQIYQKENFNVKLFGKKGNLLPFCPINFKNLDKLPENYVVSNQKIKATLGKNLPMSSRAGLLKTFHLKTRDTF